MMELKQRGRTWSVAPEACRTHVRHGTDLPPTSALCHSVADTVQVASRVTDAVAVRAEQVAFSQFGHQSLEGTIEAAEPELLGLRVKMMEFERSQARVVAAVHTPASCGRNEFFLPSLTTSLLSAICFGVAPAATGFT
jgi:hypothetical protein